MPRASLADGMIVPPPYRKVSETAQKAVIWHDGITETLILSINFKGDAEDFGWIIPVPAKPEVSKASDELFTALEELTVPKVPRYKTPLGIGGYMEAPQKSTVQIIETKRVDIYDITVLKSGTSADLATWFSENNYPYPRDAEYILDNYIDNGWYFVAAKISTKALGYKTSQQLREGHATPLKLVFRSEKIIYPLKISSVVLDYSNYPIFTPQPPIIPLETEGKLPTETSPSAKVSIPETERPPSYYPKPTPSENIKIVLYVFSSHKKTVPGYNTDYASVIKPKTIENLAFDESGEPWIRTTKKMYLTKLVRTMSTSEMTTDLILRDAEDNKPINAPGALDISGLRFWAIIAIPLILEIAFIWYLISKRKVKLW